MTLDEIEHKIACNELNAAQVFTQMKQHLNGTMPSGSKDEPVVMAPYLKDRADMVAGHYCIARLHHKGYYEYWSEKKKEWCSAGSVFELGKAP